MRSRGSSRVRRWVLRLLVVALALVLAPLGACRIAAARRERLTRTEAAPPDGRFVRAGDVEVFVQEGGPAGGPVVVFLHGTGSWGEMWRDMLPQPGSARWPWTSRPLAIPSGPRACADVRHGHQPAAHAPTPVHDDRGSCCGQLLAGGHAAAPVGHRGQHGCGGGVGPGVPDRERRAAEKCLRRDSPARMPVLLVWGSADTITPLPQGQWLAERIPGSRLVVLEGLGHIPQIESPERFNATLLAFLAAQR